MRKGLRRIICKRKRRTRFTAYYLQGGLLSCFRRSHFNVEAMFADPKNVALLWFLSELSSIFMSVRDGIEDQHENDVYPFFIRAYSFWESAVRLWASGRIPEAYCLLRAAVENFGYAFVLREESAENWNLQDWLNREADIQVHRRRFTWATMVTGLPEDLVCDIRGLYKRCIEKGAHPNPEAVNHGNDLLRGGKSVCYQSDDILSACFTSFDLVLAAILFLETFSRLYPKTFKRRRAARRLDKISKLFGQFIDRFCASAGKSLSKYKATTEISAAKEK